MFNKRLYFVAVVIFVGMVFGLLAFSSPGLHSSAYADEPKISKEALDALSKTDSAMAEVVAAVKPAVVNIQSTRTVKLQGMPSPFFNDPFFRRFFGDEFGSTEKPKERKQSGMGSGTIVDKNGYILTNNHVVQGADEIKVKLSDKREFKGKIVGTDPKTDIAVIKIEASNLPVLKLGDSDKLRAGETVIAIGNPFGLNQTVTSGIVSATGRANVGIADYEDFIQTDAAINPGNSGGALVNIRGELIGINTAIFSTSGGYQGVGFAIPSNMAKNVMETLIKNGKVIRGWLGVTVQQITPDLAKQFNLKDDEKGALIADVAEGSPAEKAGIQRGDVIVAYAGKEVNDPTSLRNSVAATAPGTEVSIKLVRDERSQTVKVLISELPSDMQKVSGEYNNALKGITVQNLTPEIRKNLEISKQVNGVIIADIAPGSPAEGFLTSNDIILEINKKRIKNMQDYSSAASKITADDNVLVLVYRSGSTFYLTLSAK